MRFRQAVAAVVLAVYLPSCTSWQVLGVDPRQAPAKAKKLRITLRNDEVVLLEGPRVEQDSLFGVRTLGPESRYARVPHAVALADIKAIEGRKFSPVLSVAVLGAVVVALRAAASDPDPSPRSGWTCDGWSPQLEEQ